jgi:hypothetical protein
MRGGHPGHVVVSRGEYATCEHRDFSSLTSKSDRRTVASRGRANPMRARPIADWAPDLSSTFANRIRSNADDAVRDLEGEVAQVLSAVPTRVVQSLRGTRLVVGGPLINHP